jgi:hypothetical protein
MLYAISEKTAKNSAAEFLVLRPLIVPILAPFSIRKFWRRLAFSLDQSRWKW